MGILAIIIILPMWLCSVHFQGTHASVRLDELRKKQHQLSISSLINSKGDDTNLNLIATDIVEDVMRVFIPYAEKLEKKVGPPKTRPLNSEITIAGADFDLRSEAGTFDSFSSLQTTGLTKVTFHLEDGPYVTHVLILHIPITFKNFTIHYDKVTIRNLEQTWNGSISLKVKNNNFLLHFIIVHSENGCEAAVQGTEILKDSNVDMDIKIEGFEELKLNNLAFPTRYNYYDAAILMEDVIGKYLSNELLGYCKFNPQWHAHFMHTSTRMDRAPYH